MDLQRSICTCISLTSAIEQMICNVLDNALEASPQWLRLDVERAGDALTLTVTDAGKGFAPGLLETLGQPYRSTKGRPGGGLGLFLVVNVARTLGGRVAVHNRPEGGAIVAITLPLAAIVLEEEEDDEEEAAEETPAIDAIEKTKAHDGNR